MGSCSSKDIKKAVDDVEDAIEAVGDIGSSDNTVKCEPYTRQVRTALGKVAKKWKQTLL